MARRVFFHIGAPKTGTTYLQRIMWHNRDALREAGVLIPGDAYVDRVWATQTVREMGQPHVRAAGAWDRIVAQVRAFDGDAVISHEFFSAATEEQAKRAIAAVGPAEVHVVYTARDLTRLVPALWQERLKYRYAGQLSEFRPPPVTAPPTAHWSWRTIDPVDALRRWAADIPADRVHVVTVPPSGSAPDLLWRRFATACGFDPAVADLDLPPANESMGLVESELLRRVNPRIGDNINDPLEVPRWVRDYLSLDVLAPRRGERIALDPRRHARMRKRSLAIVAGLREAKYDVVGDLEELVPPVVAPTTRQPEDVTDTELLDVALDVIARMLSDYRAVTRERDQLRAAVGRPAAGLRVASRLRRAAARALRDVGRPGR